MPRWFALCVFACIVLLPSWALGHPIDEEPSKFGRFGIHFAENAMRCDVSFSSTAGVTSLLFPVLDCVDRAFGATSPAPTSELFETPLPMLVGQTEFHIFEIPMARGGNASELTEY